MEELEAIREAEEAALKSAEAAAEEAALAAMNLDIIDEEDLMKPGKFCIVEFRISKLLSSKKLWLVNKNWCTYRCELLLLDTSNTDFGFHQL